jgi:hypothetical protein
VLFVNENAFVLLSQISCMPLCILSEEGMMKSEADGARHLQGYETSGERPNGLQVFEMVEET